MHNDEGLAQAMESADNRDTRTAVKQMGQELAALRRRIDELELRVRAQGLPPGFIRN